MIWFGIQDKWIVLLVWFTLFSGKNASEVLSCVSVCVFYY